MNPRLSFEAHACSSQARAAGLGDVTVTIRHIPTSTVFMLSKEDARAFAFCILKATDPERDTWTTPSAEKCKHCGGPARVGVGESGVIACDACRKAWPAETTRKACSKCLKDCAECHCVEDCISKGRG